VTYDHLCQILIAATSLVDLSICGNVIRCSCPLTVSSPQIAMPKLQSLRLRSGTYGDRMKGCVLQILTCPSLETMALFFFHDLSTFGLHHFLSSERYPSLRNLAFFASSFATSSMELMAYKIPTITHFTILYTEFGRSIDMLEAFKETRAIGCGLNFASLISNFGLRHALTTNSGAYRHATRC
jgi:hypothetical protein